MKLRVLGAVTFCQMTFGPIEFSQIINNYVPTRRTQILKGVLQYHTRTFKRLANVGQVSVSKFSCKCIMGNDVLRPPHYTDVFIETQEMYFQPIHETDNACNLESICQIELCQIILMLGGYPGVVIKGGDSYSEGREFESQHQILDGHFSH